MKALATSQAALPVIPGTAGSLAAAAPGGLAVVGAAGTGYFVGTALVRADKVYLDGFVMDNVVAPTLSIPFKGIYTLQQWIEAQSGVYR